MSYWLPEVMDRGVCGRKMGGTANERQRDPAVMGAIRLVTVLLRTSWLCPCATDVQDLTSGGN